MIASWGEERLDNLIEAVMSRGRGGGNFPTYTYLSAAAKNQTVTSAPQLLLVLLTFRQPLISIIVLEVTLKVFLLFGFMISLKYILNCNRQQFNNII